MTTSGSRPIRVHGNGTGGGYIERIAGSPIQKDEFEVPAIAERLARCELGSPQVVRRHGPFIFEEHHREMAIGCGARTFGWTVTGRML